MFDIAWTEMLVIAIVLIVVVGPKELPGMLRTVGKTTARLRVMAGDFRKQFDEALKEAELDDIKKLAEDAKKLNPVGDLKKAFNPLEAAGKDVRAGLEAAFNPPPEAPKPPTVETPKAGDPASVAVTPAATPAAPAATPAAKAAAKPVAAKPAEKSAAPAIKAAAAPAKKAAVKPVVAKSATMKPAAAAKPAATKKKTGGAAS